MLLFQFTILDTKDGLQGLLIIFQLVASLFFQCSEVFIKSLALQKTLSASF